MTGVARQAEVRDWLVPFLLLCLRGGELKGHDLLGKMADLGFGVVRPVEVYKTLRRAEEEGLVYSGWDDLGYLLSRRRYGLTEGGGAYIEFLANSLVSYREEISTFLHVYGDHPGRPLGETPGETSASEAGGP